MQELRLHQQVVAFLSAPTDTEKDRPWKRPRAVDKLVVEVAMGRIVVVGRFACYSHPVCIRRTEVYKHRIVALDLEIRVRVLRVAVGLTTTLKSVSTNVLLSPI